MSHSATHGVLIIDKPAGWTSHDVIAKARGLTRIRQIGHSGTLDPMATGVLVLCLGKATRLLEYLTGLPKTYLASITLGIATDTYDATGQPTRSVPPPRLSAETLEQALESFRGEILQRPPAYSAIKRDGVPQYKRARRGEEVTIEPRPVTIYELTLLNVDDNAIGVRVRCSAGTYVRSLAHDLGDSLGCGAHLSSLRRLAVGPFDVASAIQVEQLAEPGWERWLLPSSVAVAHMPRIDLTSEEVSRLSHGRSLTARPLTTTEPACAFDPNGEIVAIVQYDGRHQAYRPVKVFATPDE